MAPALRGRTIAINSNLMIDAMLYLDAELAVDDLASLAQDWRWWRGSRRVGISGPSGDGELAVWRGDMHQVMLRLIRPGVYGDFLLSEECLPEEFAGPPLYRPRTILALHASTSPAKNAEIGLRLAIELAADCARRWPCRLTNDAIGGGRRIYTRDEIIEAERKGELLE
jgi:hypothetical protein